LRSLPDVRLEELEFDFPEALIAQHPVEPRDSCRLMHLRNDGTRHHDIFRGLLDVLLPGDTLVFNDSRVLPARVQAFKPTGGRVELLFIRALPADAYGSSGRQGDGGGPSEAWEALARPSHKLKPESALVLPGGETLALRTLLGDGRWVVEAPAGASLVALMERYGTLPLPPYIKGYPDDPESYQTVYSRPLGSAAAPTAGLHFTSEMLEVLRQRGVGSSYVTLHVGLDTFQPIREEIVEEHRIHRESYFVSAENLRLIEATKAGGGRVVAVGTTATRVLETLAGVGGFPVPGQDAAGDTEIFITPGYRFKMVDALLTNFHLPHSSVLALVMAFAGAERLKAAYAEAVELKYRFFSFGDAMLVDGPAASQPAQAAAPHEDANK
jgi:S-adenosylmethionine:tRNA ribosyltransferase-isomerase